LNHRIGEDGLQRWSGLEKVIKSSRLQRHRQPCQTPDLKLLCAMGITITIPEEVACILGTDQKEREQRACESIALELYREGRITLRTMGRLAGVGEDYWAADAFRARHGLPVSTGDDLAENEMAAINLLLEP
jgi:hypothetical protein